MSHREVFGQIGEMFFFKSHFSVVVLSQLAETATEKPAQSQKTLSRESAYCGCTRPDSLVEIIFEKPRIGELLARPSTGCKHVLKWRLKLTLLICTLIHYRIMLSAS